MPHEPSCHTLSDRVSVCVFVCVCEKKRESERERENEIRKAKRNVNVYSIRSWRCAIVKHYKITRIWGQTSEILSSCSHKRTWWSNLSFLATPSYPRLLLSISPFTPSTFISPLRSSHITCAPIKLPLPAISSLMIMTKVIDQGTTLKCNWLTTSTYRPPPPRIHNKREYKSQPKKKTIQ